jgi:hypothetical protein
LIIGETESAVTDLFAENTVLLGQVINGVLLMFVEPERHLTRNENGLRSPDMDAAYHPARTCFVVDFNTFEFSRICQPGVQVDREEMFTLHEQVERSLVRNA